MAAVALRRRRHIGLANLARAFPALSPSERARLFRRSWLHVGMTCIEACRLRARPIEDALSRISVEGGEHLRDVMASHGRALILTGHLGNWELLALAPRLSGYPTTIVARPLDSPWLRPMADAIRQKAGTVLLDKRGALRDAMAALRAGHLVGILQDQNASRREGIFVPFFGIPACTSRSIALLALRTQTPVVPVFIRRVARGRHLVVVYPPLDVATDGEGEEPMVVLTKRCNEAIEVALRAAPEQWLWIHDRWRTQPRA
jgi:Kdo2-lipid IVA lauroyltransferase/acyltransferase